MSVSIPHEFISTSKNFSSTFSNLEEFYQVAIQNEDGSQINTIGDFNAMIIRLWKIFYNPRNSDLNEDFLKHTLSAPPNRSGRYAAQTMELTDAGQEAQVNIDRYLLRARGVPEDNDEEEEGHIYDLPDTISTIVRNKSPATLASYTSREVAAAAATAPVNVLGGIILSTICLKKIYEYKQNIDSSDTELSELIESRIRFFKSTDFITRLEESIAFRTGPRTAVEISSRGEEKVSEDSDDTGTGSYTDYLNYLFNYIGGANWRGSILAPTSNDTQCIRAARTGDEETRAQSDGNYDTEYSRSTGSSSDSINELQAQNNMRCYICGGIMGYLSDVQKDDPRWKKVQKYGDEPQKMQCEHILPIATALAHWWLVKPPGDSKATQSSLRDNLGDEVIDELALEYAFSHACCNLIKNNKEIIKFTWNDSEKRYECQADLDAIKTLLQDIWESMYGLLSEQRKEHYDCQRVGATASILANGNKQTDPINLFIVNQQNQAVMPKVKKRDSDTHYGADFQRNKIKKLIEPLTSRISINIQNTQNWQIYELFTKFKLISAISDADFLTVILNLPKDGDAAKALQSQGKQQKRTSKRDLKEIVSNYNKFKKRMKTQQTLYEKYEKILYIPTSVEKQNKNNGRRYIEGQIEEIPERVEMLRLLNEPGQLIGLEYTNARQNGITKELWDAYNSWLSSKMEGPKTFIDEDFHTYLGVMRDEDDNDYKTIAEQALSGPFGKYINKANRLQITRERQALMAHKNFIIGNDDDNWEGYINMLERYKIILDEGVEPPINIDFERWVANEAEEIPDITNAGETNMYVLKYVPLKDGGYGTWSFQKAPGRGGKELTIENLDSDAKEIKKNAYIAISQEKNVSYVELRRIKSALDAHERMRGGNGLKVINQVPNELSRESIDTINSKSTSNEIQLYDSKTTKFLADKFIDGIEGKEVSGKIFNFAIEKSDIIEAFYNIHKEKSDDVTDTPTPKTSLIKVNKLEESTDPNCPAKNIDINMLECTRKNTLKIHPDKNPGCTDLANEKFNKFKNVKCKGNFRSSGGKRKTAKKRNRKKSKRNKRKRKKGSRKKKLNRSRKSKKNNKN